MKKAPAVLLVLILITLYPALAVVTSAAKDVPYVPTPEEVVEEMLRLAAVQKGDVVYDLGCGDGRIVVTAARERGARGVGVDIDPVRIAESRSRAQREGVADRVRFHEGDLFKVDMRPANVVTLYLLPAVNLRLRPKLLSELKPGSRVVSHDFDMGDWEADQVTEMPRHMVFFWKIPANATGTWEWTHSSPLGEERSRLELTQSFQKVAGRLIQGGKALPIRDGRLDGDRLRFTVEGSVSYEARVAGERLQGVRRAEGTKEQPWEAARDPRTKVPLE